MRNITALHSYVMSVELAKLVPQSTSNIYVMQCLLQRQIGSLGYSRSPKRFTNNTAICIITYLHVLIRLAKAFKEEGQCSVRTNYPYLIGCQKALRYSNGAFTGSQHRSLGTVDKLGTLSGSHTQHSCILLLPPEQCVMRR